MKWILALGSVFGVGSGRGAIDAAEPKPAGEVKRSTWNGLERLDFQVDGRDCILIVPPKADIGRPWIWRTEFFGHEPQADIALTGKGFHIAYVNVQNLYGAPKALDAMDKLYDHVTREYGLMPKVALEGFSRGGLFALNWAARHPDRVACIYNDAPVCDFKAGPEVEARGRDRLPIGSGVSKRTN